jgi:hypothetical protein
MIRKIAVGFITMMLVVGTVGFVAPLQASAQAITVSQLIELLISLGVISADKVPAARAFLNANTTTSTAPSSAPVSSVNGITTVSTSNTSAANAAPYFSFSKRSFEFFVNQGDQVAPPVQSITFTNTGNANANFKIVVDNQPTWLNAGYNKDSMTAYAGNPVGIGASVDASRLNPGTYSTNIKIVGDFANSPVIIPVSLTVRTVARPTSPVATNLSVVSARLPAGVAGQYYKTEINVAGGLMGAGSSAVLSYGSLPPGISFATCSTNICAGLAGTPTAGGTYSFGIRFTQDSQTVTGNFVINVEGV